MACSERLPNRGSLAMKVHVSLMKVLGLLGMGRKRVIAVPTDDAGTMRADACLPWTDRTIVCITAGNVN